MSLEQSGGGDAGPLVTFIIPAFNAAATLEAALDSVLAQTVPDWEAVVVDDGSTDATPEIIRSYTPDARIVAAQSGGGNVSVARNTALQRARGEWVIFLDADDELPPDHLEAMLAAAGNAPEATLIHCGWRRFAPDGTLLSEEPAHALADPFAVTASRCPFAIHSAMTRRRALLELAGFDQSVRICQDWDLWQRLARSGARFVPAPDHAVEVWMTPDSLSSDTVRLMEEGLATIERAFRPDPRLPLPAGDRLPGIEHPAPRTYYALWSLGNVIGARQDIERALALVDDLQVYGVVDIGQAAATLVDGMLIGARRPFGDWPVIWPPLRPGFDALIGFLDRRRPRLREGGWLRNAVEKHVSTLLGDVAELSVGALRVTTVDLGKPIRNCEPGAGIDRLRLRFSRGGQVLGESEMLVAGPVPAAIIARHALRAIDAEAIAPDESPEPPNLERRNWWSRLLGRASKPEIDRLTYAPLAVELPAIPDPLAALIAQAEAARPAPATVGDASPSEWVPPDYSSAEYWDEVFASPDPWEYESDYEATKYRQTLEMVPAGEIGRALEIACAEGHFTRQLAGKVGQVMATDISPTALERAAHRCAGLDNVEFTGLDLARDAMPGRFDLVVCSEVLYYLPGSDALAAFAAKIAEALRDGGRVLLAHGNLLVDEPDRTGFPWPHEFGAKSIGEAFAAAPGLHLERELWTPLYRIQLFRKADEPPEPALEVGDAAVRLPLRIAEQVRWRGGGTIAPASSWHNFPILMYHRIADDGLEALARYRVTPRDFEAQLRMLAEAGWQGVTLARLAAAMHKGEALPPNCVVLTFDDAYRDFIKSALPLLHRHGFPASVFVPAGKVGQTSDWDASYGEPAALMNWDDLALLRHCDVELGSHGVSHTPLPALPAAGQIDQLIASRSEIGSRVDAEITAIAYPFGEVDAALVAAAGSCGYLLGLSCDYGWVDGNCDPLRLPRVEIHGDLTLEGFKALLGI